MHTRIKRRGRDPRTAAQKSADEQILHSVERKRILSLIKKNGPECLTVDDIRYLSPEDILSFDMETNLVIHRRLHAAARLKREFGIDV